MRCGRALALCGEVYAFPMAQRVMHSLSEMSIFYVRENSALIECEHAAQERAWSLGSYVYDVRKGCYYIAERLICIYIYLCHWNIKCRKNGTYGPLSILMVIYTQLGVRTDSLKRLTTCQPVKSFEFL